MQYTFICGSQGEKKYSMQLVPWPVLELNKSSMSCVINTLIVFYQSADLKASDNYKFTGLISYLISCRLK